MGLTTRAGSAKQWLCREFRGILGQRIRSPSGDDGMPMASNESNLEIRSAATTAELEQRQRRRMLAALAVLLTTLIVVIIRDRQFWFPPSSEPVALDQPPASAAPLTPTPAGTVPSTESTPKITTPSHSRRSHGRHSPVPARPDSAAAAAAPPMVATTSRAVLPPLDIEVVAGNQHRTLTPGSNSVKVDMQSGAPVSAPAAPSPTPDAAAQVSMSAPTAERVTRTVTPSYPLLAKQMKV